MALTDITQAAAHALYHALRSGEPIGPLTETYEGLTVDDAYKISLAVLALRKAAGEKEIGKKIGITSDAVMNMLGVDQPDFGFLTDTMWAKDNVVDTTNMILPRAEAEIAFRLKADLSGPGVTEENVLAATESVAACFEVVDSRVKDWKIKIHDTIAEATLGSPLKAVAWLANTLGERGIPFKAGEIILSGSLVPLEPVAAGDQMNVSIEGIGDCNVSFI